MSSNPLLRHFRDAAAMVERVRDDFLDRGVEAGTLTKAISPDETLEVYAERWCGLTNGDFESHLIHAAMGQAPNLKLHQMHRSLVQSDPCYAARYRDAELAAVRMKKGRHR